MNNKSVNLCYRNQMYNSYKLDEQAITNIIHRHTKQIKILNLNLIS